MPQIPTINERDKIQREAYIASPIFLKGRFKLSHRIEIPFSVVHFCTAHREKSATAEGLLGENVPIEFRYLVFPGDYRVQFELCNGDITKGEECPATETVTSDTVAKVEETLVTCDHLVSCFMCSTG